MRPTLFRRVMGDSPRIRAIEYLISWNSYDMTITDLAKGAGMTRVTATKIVDDLKKEKIIIHVRNIGSAKLFALDHYNPVVKELKKLFKAIVVNGI